MRIDFSMLYYFIFISVRTSDKEDEELCKLYDNELSLTEHCLKYNPKSYCAWHQRVWVLTTRTNPDWKHELYLCEKYLSFDERNCKFVIFIHFEFHICSYIKWCQYVTLGYKHRYK